MTATPNLGLGLGSDLGHEALPRPTNRSTDAAADTRAKRTTRLGEDLDRFGPDPKVAHPDLLRAQADLMVLIAIRMAESHCKRN